MRCAANWTASPASPPAPTTTRSPSCAPPPGGRCSSPTCTLTTPPRTNCSGRRCTKPLADRPDDLALLDALEAEHATIDPLLAAIDSALADRDSGPARLGELADALTTALRGHLDARGDGGPAPDRLDNHRRALAGVPRGKRQAGRRRRHAIMPWMFEGVAPEVTFVGAWPVAASAPGGLPRRLAAGLREPESVGLASLTLHRTTSKDAGAGRRG